MSALLNYADSMGPLEFITWVSGLAVVVLGLKAWRIVFKSAADGGVSLSALDSESGQSLKDEFLYTSWG